jgi:hypothetical protein
VAETAETGRRSGSLNVVLPPNPLTELLAGCATPLVMYQNLRARGLLSREARSRPWEVVDFIVRTLAEAKQHAGRAMYCGPSDMDCLARELTCSHYLDGQVTRSL